MNICDIACNFTSDRFASDLDDVINRALKRNVKNFVLLCSELDEANKILKIKDSYPSNIFFTYGTHPHNANTFNSKSIPLLNNLISKRRPNAIGEIGLDYFRNHSSQEEQIFAFEEQIKIALDNGLPIYLHQRDAHDDFINLLKKDPITKKQIKKYGELYQYPFGMTSYLKYPELSNALTYQFAKDSKGRMKVREEYVGSYHITITLPYIQNKTTQK